MCPNRCAAGRSTECCAPGDAGVGGGGGGGAGTGAGRGGAAEQGGEPGRGSAQTAPAQAGV